MFKQFFVLFCLVALIIACQPTETPELTDAQHQAIADEIRQKTQEMWDLAREFNEESFNKMMDFVVESDEESWMGNQHFGSATKVSSRRKNL